MFGSSKTKADYDRIDAENEERRRLAQQRIDRMREAGYGEQFTPATAARCFVCDQCGAVVANQDVHTTWHRDLLTGPALADAFRSARYSAAD